MIREVFYNYGPERSRLKSENHQTQKQPSAHLKSRRQLEIKKPKTKKLPEKTMEEGSENGKERT